MDSQSGSKNKIGHAKAQASNAKLHTPTHGRNTTFIRPMNGESANVLRHAQADESSANTLIGHTHVNSAQASHDSARTNAYGSASEGVGGRGEGMQGVMSVKPPPIPSRNRGHDAQARPAFDTAHSQSGPQVS